MAGNRDVILADFQACTDIDDVAEAILHLETCNWDLLAAINNVMPQNSQQLPSEMNRDVEMIEEIKRAPAVAPDVAPLRNNLPGTSSRIMGNNTNQLNNLKDSSRTLTFLINYLSKVYEIKISESKTLGDLKIEIFKSTNVTACNQQLHGWKKEPGGDHVTLRFLNLSRKNELFMSPANEVGDNASEVINLSDRLAQTYTLNVKDEIKNVAYNLNFPGSCTVLEVKTNVYTLIDVPVRNQLWKGWPSTVKDDSLTLAQCGISYPEHDLSVGRIPIKEKKSSEIVDLIESDSSLDDLEENEDYEDAPESFQVDDDIFVDHVVPPKTQNLISNNVEDEIVGTLEFAQNFEKRYGVSHPTFFTGTFEEAVAESCSKSPKDRKLLAVYLHHDNSILTNVFCTQLLGFETVLQLLSANFIVWGWDCTHDSNEQKFLASVQQVLGPVAAMTVRNIEVDTMPVLLIIMRSRSNTEIFTIIHGNIGVNDLLTNLIEAVDVFTEQRQNDIEIDNERQARERVKEEQDRAYQESLAVDMAKEKAKMQQEKAERERLEQIENERAEEEAKIEAIRLAVESTLPPEPSEDLETVLKIRVRPPSEGKILERRFLPETTLQTLLNFLISKGFRTEDYKILQTFPRKDLTTIDSNLTLRQLNFCQQETLVIQER